MLNKQNGYPEMLSLSQPLETLGNIYSLEQLFYRKKFVGCPCVVFLALFFFCFPIVDILPLLDARFTAQRV